MLNYQKKYAIRIKFSLFQNSAKKQVYNEVQLLTPAFLINIERTYSLKLKSQKNKHAIFFILF